MKTIGMRTRTLYRLTSSMRLW